MRKKTPLRRRIFRSLGSMLRTVFRPRNALPCVGLIVLGGCLTFIITPDESGDPASAVTSAAGDFPTVVIDPGHGGRDDGTRWRGLAEKELTLDLAQRVERMMKSSGFKTVLTRRDDTFVPLEERARIANNVQNAIFISLHFNSENSTAFTGIETHYARGKEIPPVPWNWIGFFNRGETVPTDTSEALAGAIQTTLAMRTEAKNRGIHASNFYVVHRTRCPAVLVEGGFISNAFEAQLLKTEPYRETLAEGIVEGVLRYIQARPPETPGLPVTAQERP